LEEKSNENKEKAKNHQKIVAKGAVFEVGKHSGITKPNTSLELVECIMQYFCFDQ